jgi:hypothetical protein
MKTYRIQFITPLFSHGAYEDLPEIRSASIRGQLHQWLRMLGGKPADERAIFGSVHKDFGGRDQAPTASRLVIRVSDLPKHNGPAPWLPTLPHKPGGANPRNAPNAPRCAFAAGTNFTLMVGERLGGLTEAHWKLADRTIHTWLLAGSLGLRGTRGGGSICWKDAPSDVKEYRERLAELLNGAPLKYDLLERAFADSEDARKVITQTIDHRALHDISYPLGAVRQGVDDPAPSRKTSPLRLTIRQFADGCRILAIWDDRQSVSGNKQSQLRSAVERLADGTPRSQPTEIGRLLKESNLY